MARGAGSSEFDNVRSELVDAVEINVAAPAPEDSEKFAEVAFTPSQWGHTSFNGDNYYLGIFATSTGQNDPGLYEMLEGNGPAQGIPSRTPPTPDEGGPDANDTWTENSWFGEFERSIWASITESEGTLQALNTWDSAFLSVGPIQQTAGTQDGKGELQGALHTLQAKAPDVYWRHFGRFGLQPVRPVLSQGAKKAHFELRGERLDSGDKKERLRQFKWPYLFQRAMQNATVRYWMMREGFERLRRIRNREMTLEVNRDDQEEPAQVETTIGDIFQRDLSQALVLDWHVNSPADVWAQHRPRHPDFNQQTGNNWLGSAEEAFAEWGIHTAEELPLTEDQERKLVADLLGARLGNMSDPDGRAIGILKYTENDEVQELANAHPDTPNENSSVDRFLRLTMGVDTQEADCNEERNPSTWCDIQNHPDTSLGFNIQ